MPGWDGTEDLLIELADIDLAAACAEGAPPGITPMLVAFDGDEHLVVAGLRRFEDGAYPEALVELLALAVPIGADRVALSIAGRAWSLDDPIPPVSADADLRQRTLVLTFVDGHDRPRPEVTTVLHPFDVVDGGIVWGERRDLGAPDPGAVTAVVSACLSERGVQVAAEHAEPSTLRRQAERCERLGHRIWLGDEAARRLLTDILDERRLEGVTPPA